MLISQGGLAGISLLGRDKYGTCLVHGGAGFECFTVVTGIAPTEALLTPLLVPACCCQVPAYLHSSVAVALARVLEEPEEQGETFLQLFYKLLQKAAKQGTVEGMIRRLFASQY